MLTSLGCLYRPHAIADKTTNWSSYKSYTFKTDLLCLCETRTRNPTSSNNLWSPQATVVFNFRLHQSGDSFSSARCHAGVCIGLSTKFESALLQSMPVNGSLCAVRSYDFVRVGRSPLKGRHLFTMSFQASTGCSPRMLFRSFRDVHLTDAVNAVAYSDVWRRQNVRSKPVCYLNPSNQQRWQSHVGCSFSPVFTTNSCWFTTLSIQKRKEQGILKDRV